MQNHKLSIFKFFLSLFALASLASCYDVVDVNVPEGEKLLAVEGMITNQPGPYTIKLTYTSPYFDNKPNPEIKEAYVELRDSEGLIDILQQVAPGVYQTKSIQGKIGNKYTLTIKADGEEYKAETEIKRVPPIDSLAFEYQIKDPNDDDDRSGYIAKYYGPELEGENDYYRFKAYRNDTVFGQKEDLIFTSDQFVDGNYIADIEFEDYVYQPKDKIRIETLTITEDAYYFYLELITQLNNADAGLFANPVANIRTNVINQDANSKKRAVGYFVGAGMSFKEGMVESEETVIK